MGKINGSAVLVYADGTLIAAQKGCTISVTQAVYDTTNKESSGWAEHENGIRSAEVPFDALASTVGLSAKELFAYIIGRSSLLLTVEGLAYPCVCEADVANSSIVGPSEDASTISGSFKVKGKFYYLSSDYEPLVIDMNDVANTFDTYIASNKIISSAINLSGFASCISNMFSVLTGDVVKVFIYLTVASGQAPRISLTDTNNVDKSALVTLTAGLNVVTLVSTDDTDVGLKFYNTSAAEWSTSNIYCFKDNP